MNWHISYKIEPTRADCVIIRYYLEFSGIQVPLKTSKVVGNNSLEEIFDIANRRVARYRTDFRDFLLMCDADPNDEQ